MSNAPGTRNSLAFRRDVMFISELGNKIAAISVSYKEGEYPFGKNDCYESRSGFQALSTQSCRISTLPITWRAG